MSNGSSKMSTFFNLMNMKGCYWTGTPSRYKQDGTPMEVVIRGFMEVVVRGFDVKLFRSSRYVDFRGTARGVRFLKSRVANRLKLVYKLLYKH